MDSESILTVEVYIGSVLKGYHYGLLEDNEKFPDCGGVFKAGNGTKKKCPD